MKKYIVVEAKADEFQDVFDTLDEANKFALDSWNHLTNYEKKGTHIYVCFVTEKDLAAGTVSKMDMPALSNVLQYFTADGSKVSIRPSGTEPKIKFYIEVKGKMETVAEYDAAAAAAKAKVDAIKKDLGI